MSEKKEIVKGRDWTFVVYPESAPENWRTILDETFMRWVESPLHDKDVNADGEIKSLIGIYCYHRMGQLLKLRYKKL